MRTRDDGTAPAARLLEFWFDFASTYFIVGDELFWCQDRLAAALEWARQPGGGTAV